MKVYSDVVQGSAEWLALRAGRPTASVFSEIVTPGGKLSKSSDRLMYTLLAERVMGKPAVEHVSYWMDRGTNLEAEAVSYFETVREVDTVKVGIVFNDAGTVGASPDRFVGNDGLLEIKCPSIGVHAAYLFGHAGVDEKYKCQVMGQLWITEREYADTLSYHPELPWAIVRAHRDEAFIATLSEAVLAFSDRLEEAALKLTAEGFIKPRQPEPTPEGIGSLGITDDDISTLMASYDWDAMKETA